MRVFIHKCAYNYYFKIVAYKTEIDDDEALFVN